jgi:hypothetical protein
VTKQQILSGTLEWLNEQAAKAMGFEYGIDIGWEEPWIPAEDIRDAWELEEKIKEMGLIDKYIYGFIDVVGFETVYYDGPMPTNEGLFQITHATPQQRCKAFLLAMMEPGN